MPTLGRSIRPTDDLRALAELTAEMRRFRPHIVHTHTAKAGTLGRVAAIVARVPGRVHTFHGHLLKGYFPPRTVRLIRAAESMLAKHTDHLIAVGDRVRDDLLAAGIGHAGQYSVVPPGTSLAPLPDRQMARKELGLPTDGSGRRVCREADPHQAARPSCRGRPRGHSRTAGRSLRDLRRR